MKLQKNKNLLFLFCRSQLITKGVIIWIKSPIITSRLLKIIQSQLPWVICFPQQYLIILSTN